MGRYCNVNNSTSEIGRPSNSLRCCVKLKTNNDISFCLQLSNGFTSLNYFESLQCLMVLKRRSNANDERFLLTNF